MMARVIILKVVRPEFEHYTYNCFGIKPVFNKRIRRHFKSMIAANDENQNEPSLPPIYSRSKRIAALDGKDWLFGTATPAIKNRHALEPRPKFSYYIPGVGPMFRTMRIDSLTGPEIHTEIYTNALKQPQVIKRLTDIHAGAGDSVALRCEIHGDPKPEIYWYKDGKLLLSNNKLWMHYQNGKEAELIISCATERDAGWYTCKARNCFGSRETSCSVRVESFLNSQNNPWRSKAKHFEKRLLFKDYSRTANSPEYSYLKSYYFASLPSLFDVKFKRHWNRVQRYYGLDEEAYKKPLRDWTKVTSFRS